MKWFLLFLLSFSTLAEESLQELGERVKALSLKVEENRVKFDQSIIEYGQTLVLYSTKARQPTEEAAKELDRVAGRILNHDQMPKGEKLDTTYYVPSEDFVRDMCKYAQEIVVKLAGNGGDCDDYAYIFKYACNNYFRSRKFLTEIKAEAIAVGVYSYQHNYPLKTKTSKLVVTRPLTCHALNIIGVLRDGKVEWRFWEPQRAVFVDLKEWQKKSNVEKWNPLFFTRF